jgi:hypothetical protein
MPNGQTDRFSEGPFLSAGFLCEKILEEKDGTKSAIRIIDRITLSGMFPPGTPNQITPSQMPAFPIQPVLFLRFKSGLARGPMPLEVSLFKPSGDSMGQPISLGLNFEGEEDRGQDIVINLNMMIESPGLYWIDVRLNNLMVTRIYFRIQYAPFMQQQYR